MPPSKSDQSTAASLTERLSALGLRQDSFEALDNAHTFSAKMIERARKTLETSFGEHRDFDDCLVFGSIARREATACSDLDFLLLTNDSDSVPKEKAKEELLNQVFTLLSDLAPGDNKFQPPGKTGLFQEFISAETLIRGIGLQQDTNETLTRRVLLLEESAPLLSPDRHRSLVNRIINSYMELRNPESKNPPRALINDIIRYWRTIAVDYHAKSSRDGARYSLRYLKLLFSRQVCYFSSIAPMYLMTKNSKGNAIDFLVEQFSTPPISRTVTLFEKLFENPETQERLQPIFNEIITSMNEFISRSGDEQWRHKINSECEQKCPLEEMPSFSEARKRGIELHQALATTLLDPALLKFTKEYILL